MEFRTKEQVVEQWIRELISSGELLPGDRVHQTDMARRLGVSATPIREALSRLEAHGLLVHDPHKGMRVAETRPEDAREVYLMRASLEALAVSEAASRLAAVDLKALESLQRQMEEAVARSTPSGLRALNAEWHFVIYRAAAMPRLLQTVEQLWTQFPWDTLYVLPGRADRSMEEHRRVLSALRSGDGAAAAAEMGEHIRAGCQAVLEYLAKGTREQ